MECGTTAFHVALEPNSEQVIQMWIIYSCFSNFFDFKILATIAVTDSASLTRSQTPLFEKLLIPMPTN